MRSKPPWCTLSARTTPGRPSFTIGSRAIWRAIVRRSNHEPSPKARTSLEGTRASLMVASFTSGLDGFGRIRHALG